MLRSDQSTRFGRPPKFFHRNTLTLIASYRSTAIPENMSTEYR